MPCDVDDTAKTIISLNLVGRRADCQGMISAFEESTRFKTYDCEVNPSFSANCNVLSALVSVETPSQYRSSIAKALGYVCRAWHDGECGDKWVSGWLLFHPEDYSLMDFCVRHTESRTAVLYDDPG